ncbi:chloroplastic group IIB intron splicing facilitator CRS2-B, chloroplastic-like isoform X2 [Punica granatum]|uniref:Chloroplastic group IIB intron splicing facilitator CRS2-B, chloroplastic-like isoform X2 n=1 Tax=Punica granatum TaxID=22663 RepID=A0A6P8DJ65_PUNGR|nr:chloroplastic group IIB intron splicing facilitator CRS2-B, chloroplastic-like isoform X2 [Punica granatum]
MLNAVSATNLSISCPRRLQFQHPCLRKIRSAPIRIRIYASAPNDEERLKVEYTPWLIVGLGNPGNKYHGTRHNVGFEMIDQISQAEGVPMNTIQSKALIGIGSFCGAFPFQQDATTSTLFIGQNIYILYHTRKIAGSIGEVPIVLAKPQAYINFSGESVAPLALYYQVPLRHILLIYDEMSLPNGVMKLQPKGGHGHHNGVRSVVGHLDGRREFPRLCIGIGNPPGNMDMKAFLLQKFSSVEREQVHILSFCRSSAQ